SLSVSSVSSVSSASSSSSSVRSADSDDMYADLASPVSSASSRSPTPNHSRKERGPRDRPPHGRDRNRDRPSKKDESFREDRRKNESSGPPSRGGNPMPRSGPGSRGGHPGHPPPGSMGPPGSYGGSGSHKDIKLTLLNKGDKGSRKRYLPSDKDRPGSPLSKRMALSPDRGRDKRIPGRPPLSPRMDRSRGQGPRPMPPQGDRFVQPPACCHWTVTFNLVHFVTQQKSKIVGALSWKGGTSNINFSV
ncbi:zinc finger CCCH domain-containing protein 18-like, partial [Plectropomus leopardus]|uniref:zinc finger CCCH domain-containing protein 18-like n=1 Tax=Plectropomus leopardus TaxID=160734 RepID=UPI001C4CEFFC